MRPYGPELFDDAALLAEIQTWRAERKKAAFGDIAVIAGENRRLEYAPKQIGLIDLELEQMYAEARRRGMDIGGDVSAITVEIG